MLRLQVAREIIFRNVHIQHHIQQREGLHAIRCAVLNFAFESAHLFSQRRGGVHVEERLPDGFPREIRRVDGIRLAGAPVADKTLLVRETDHLCDQTRFADPGFRHNGDDLRFALPHQLEDLINALQFLLPPNHWQSIVRFLQANGALFALARHSEHGHGFGFAFERNQRARLKRELIHDHLVHVPTQQDFPLSSGRH